MEGVVGAQLGGEVYAGLYSEDVNTYRCVYIDFWYVFSRTYIVALWKVWLVLRGGAT